MDGSHKGSSARLWRLIEQRAQPGADTAEIDQRIWELFGEDWTVVFTDLAGFSRQVAEFGIIHFLQVIFDKQQLLMPLVDAHDGILVKVEADSFLLIFKQPARALACAIEMQRVCRHANEHRPPEEQIVLCVGIGRGRVLKIGDDDVFGHQVNLASKLGEDVAKGGEILATAAAREAIGDLSEMRWEECRAEFAGEQAYWRARYQP